MPRSARIIVPGCLHHITQRGNYQQHVFDEDQDRIVYLKYLQENSDKFGMEVYAFCLMNNHVHFIVKPRYGDSVAKIFSIAHMRYAHYFNSKRKQKGHLWQGRYYSCVLGPEHIYRAVRYVERNPVRAGIVSYPWDFKWSSAAARLGRNYNVIKLTDIQEYVNVESWKQYLMEEEGSEELEELRKMTRQCK